MDMPVTNSVGNFREALLNDRTVLGFLQRDHNLSIIEVDQRAQPWQLLGTLEADGLRLQRFQRESRNWPEVGSRLCRGDPSRKRPPGQSLGLCQMIEQLVRIPAAVVVAGAEEEDALPLWCG